MPDQTRRWNQVIKFLAYSALFVFVFCVCSGFLISSGRPLEQIAAYFGWDTAGTFTLFEVLAFPALLSSAFCMLLLFSKTILASKMIRLALLSCLILPVAIVCVYYWQIGRFDSERWKESKPTSRQHFHARLNMVGDLLRRYDLRGMSKEKIGLLLGKPPATQYFREFDYVYWLGPERGFFPIDSEWLCIKFQKEKVIEVRLLRD